MKTISARDYIRRKDRTVYKINGSTRQYLIGTEVGLQWEEFPYFVEVPQHITLHSYKDVALWLEEGLG